MLFIYARAVSARFLVLLFLLLGAFRATTYAQGNCECTNCPQFMQDNFVGSFLINVQNASNPMLGQGGQGVCGVNLHFDHEYIGDLSITLTSPGGQTVTLVGPIGLFGETDGSEWNISFVPCGDAADPDPGFNANWSNNQPWGLNGSYFGSYYPANGCLENFNSGPVNGTWSLTVTDGQANDVGNFLDYEIIFCDPSGIDCFSCGANAGELPQPDLSSCEGASNLDLELPPLWTPATAQPPAPEYGYTYIISGPGGIILDFDPDANLTSYSPGVYSVCGLSYLTAQVAEIPTPNGALTVNQLRTQLNSTTAPFCGKVTTNCVNVTINPAPEDTEEVVEICAPQCYLFNGINRCQSGTYTANLLQNGCPYTATLHLTVGQPKITNLFEVICDGGCSTNPAFPGVCESGTHTQVLETYQGCDSTVNLNVTVIPVTAVIANQPVVPCGGGTVQLSGLGSSSGGYTYLWTASNGGVISGPTNLINANITAAGDYQLRVCRNLGAVLCCDSAQVTIEAATEPPAAPAQINGLTPLCQGQTFNYSIAPVSGASSYTWTVPAGVTVNSGGTGLVTNITWGTATGGQVCVTANNGCGASDPTCLNIDINSIPVVTAPQGSNTVCSANNGSYSIPAVTNATTYAWTVNAPAQILSGQGTNAVQVAWNGATSATLCVTASNTCGTSTQQCLPITVNSIPAAPVISGAANACTQATGTYTVATVPGAVSYNWTVTGGVVSSGNGTPSAQITWNNNVTTGTVCVKAVNTCGESTETCFNVALGAPPPQPTVSGVSALCPGDTAVYTATTIGGAAGYTWSVPSGAAILSGQGSTTVTVVFGAAPGGNVGVSVNGSCGAAPQVNFPVTVNPIPAAQAGMDTVQCGNTITLTGIGGTGIWTQASGLGSAVFANASNANTAVTAPQSGNYTFVWTVNAAGCTASDSLLVQFESIPSAGNSSFICDAANENYTVSFPINGGTPPYSVNGGTVSGNIFTSGSIVSGVAYQFTITDANNCISAVVQGSYNCNCSTNAGSMNLSPLSACGTETVTGVQQTPPVLDGNDIGIFILHEGSGISIINPIAQNSSGTFGFQTGMVYGQTYYISYAAGNNVAGAPDPADACYAVAQGQPVVFYAMPVADAGTILQNCGNSIALNATGAGTWSVLNGPASGLLQFTNQADPLTSVSASIPGTYTLLWTVSANGCTDLDTTEITFSPVPVVANIDRICDANNQSYTVSFDLSSGTPPYIINGTTITGTHFDSAPLNNGQTYTFTISDGQGCTATAISGSYACNCTTDAGTMAAAPLEACVGQTVTAQANNDTNLDGNDIVSYILHDASGTTAGTVLDQNATGVFAFLPGMVPGQPYYISRVAGNPLTGLADPMDPCYSVSAGQQVVFFEVPTPDAGVDLETCGTEINLSGVADIFPGTWSFVSGPGVATIVTPQSATSEVGVSTAGIYTFRWTATNGLCTGSDDMMVEYYPLPSASISSEDCNSINTQYAVTIEISGGTAPYSVSGMTGVVSGSTFVSSLINTNTTYSATVTDANGCTFGPVTGVKNCNCSTDAGSMGITPLTFCSDQPAVGVWNNDGQLDGNDIAGFVLHTLPGVALGQVLGVATTPSFDFGPGLVIGQTYYISAVAGNNNNGLVDINDPCFSLAAGTPVIWKALPTATLAGTATICEGNTTELVLNGTGLYPLTVTWTDPSGQSQTTTITGAQGAKVPVSPLQTGVYNLVSVTDGGLPSCTSDVQGAVTITVNSLAGAGIAGPDGEVCADQPEIFTLSELLTGEDNNGVWSETSVNASVGGAFNAANGTFNSANQVPGTYSFKYKVNPVAPCPSDEAIVNIIVRPQPAADAGPDQLVDCNTPTVTLGGAGTGSAPTLTYQWLLDGNILPAANGRFTETGTGGTYTLNVTNQFGCVNSDEVTVATQLEQPVFDEIIKTNVRCHGLSDGTISIAAVSGGVPPYMFSLNGGPFSTNTTYGPLVPGVYLLEAVDANGCSRISDSIFITEPPILTVDLGADLRIRLGDTLVVNALLGNVNIAQLDTIVWTPLLDTAGVGTLSQHFIPVRSGGMNILVRDENGCVSADALLYEVDQRRHVFVPNIFYPSGSENNIVTIYGGNDVARIEYFKIFDRWGNQVHEATNFQQGDHTKGWNGMHQGKLVQPAVFVWTAAVLFKDGLVEIYTGDVTVLR